MEFPVNLSRDGAFALLAVAASLFDCGCGPRDQGIAPDLQTQAVDAAMTDGSGMSGDLARSALPGQILRAQLLDPHLLFRVSTFRSDVGNDYSDDFETCRSMKHYFEPPSGQGAPAWSSIEIRSPVDGTVFQSAPEQMDGTQISIQPSGDPDWLVRLFHLNLDTPLPPGTVVHAGQRLGTHAGDMLLIDVAISRFANNKEHLVSYFDALPDALFSDWQARGAKSRGDFVITQAARDADPLTCTRRGPLAGGGGNLPSWFMLSP